MRRKFRQMVMKPLISGIAVTVLCAGCATQVSQQITPSANEISISVPARLDVERTDSIFSVDFDDFKSLLVTNITVNPALTDVTIYDVYVYRAGQQRPAEPTWHSRHRDLDFGFAPCAYYQLDNGFPLPSRTYIVDMDAAVVETQPDNLDDCNFGLPINMVARDTRFKILWREHLERLVK